MKSPHVTQRHHKSPRRQSEGAARHVTAPPRPRPPPAVTTPQTHSADRGARCLSVRPSLPATTTERGRARASGVCVGGWGACVVPASPPPHLCFLFRRCYRRGLARRVVSVSLSRSRPWLLSGPPGVRAPRPSPSLVVNPFRLPPRAHNPADNP